MTDIRSAGRRSARRCIDAARALARERDVDAYVVGGTRARRAARARRARSRHRGERRRDGVRARAGGAARRRTSSTLDDERGVARRRAATRAATGRAYIDVAATAGHARRGHAPARLHDRRAGGAARRDGRDRLCRRARATSTRGVVRMNAPLRVRRRSAAAAARRAHRRRAGVHASSRRRQREIAPRAPRASLRAAAERRRDELARIFALDDVVRGACGCSTRSGCSTSLLPELAAGRGVDAAGRSSTPTTSSSTTCTPSRRWTSCSRRARRRAEPAWMWDELWATFGWCERELRAYLAEEMSEGRSRRRC